SATDIQGGHRGRRLDVDRVQRIEDVPGVEDRPVSARDQGKLGYLGIDELSESREELDRLDREASRVDPIGEAPLELAEIRVQVTRELKREWRAGAPVRHRSRGPRHPPERFRESARPAPRWVGRSFDAFPA